MSLDTLKRQLEKETEQKLSLISKETDEEIKAIDARAEKAVSVYEKERKDRLDAELAEIRRREDAMVELEGKKILQHAKSEAIDALFADLREKVSAIPAKERAKMLASLLSKAKKELDIACVYANEEDARLINGVTVKVRPMLGGLVAENRDGTIRADYSFDSMLADLRHHAVARVSAMLF